MNSRGAILIVTLWILSILILFVLGLGFRMSLEARLTDYNVEEMKNLYLAKAAVHMLKAVLPEDETEGYDALSDNWSHDEDYFKDVTFGDGTFTISYVRPEGGEKIFYGAMDEESRININEIAKRMIQRDKRCTEILLALFEAEDNKDEIVDSILDWIDVDGVSREEGAENTYYQHFAEPPYPCKDGPLESIEELLLVRGITPEVFNNVKDKITIYGNGKVNLNTAGPAVMWALGLHENLIEEIMERRGGDEEEGFSEENPFKSTGEVTALLPDLGLSPNEISKMSGIIKDFTCVKSDFFRAYITARSEDGKVTKLVEAVVSRSGKKDEILFWHEH